MKVAMVGYTFYEGNSRVQQYIKALAMRGDTVDFICLNPADLPSVEISGNVTLHRIMKRSVQEESRLGYLFRVMRFLFVSAWILARTQLRKRYDLIHVHSVPDFLVFAALVPKLIGAGVILDIHDILPEFYTARFKEGKSSFVFKLLVQVERVSIALADRVIVANPIWRERLISRSVKSEKVTAIGNYPNPDIFCARSKERSDQKFIMTYPGSLNWHQGLDIAIKAFSKIEKEIPEAEFHIYGGGPEKQGLQNLVDELGLGAKIKFLGYRSTEEIARLMAEADLAVVPKRSKSTFGTEAASTKVLEFMAVGVPVVVSRTKIDSLYYTDNMVRFYDGDDPDELAKAILCLHKDPSMRNRLAANGLAYALEQGWNHKKQSYLAIVDSLVRPRPYRTRYLPDQRVRSSEE
jgi:glycosyltransferase involved in cell wall biosynthesis